MNLKARPRWSRFLAIAALSMTGTAAAQSEAERAEKWFRTMATEAAENFKGRSFKMAYSVEVQETLDPNEISAIRSRVANLPAHPDRARLQRLEHLQKYGPAMLEYTMWFRRGDMRLNREGERHVPGAEYLDTTSIGDVGWKMTPKTLFVVPTGQSAPRGHDVQMVTKWALTEAKVFFGAGMSGFGDVTQDTQFRMIDDNRWTASNKRVIGGNERSVEVRGTWDAQVGRGRSIESSLSSVGNGAKVLYRVTAERWIEFDGMEVATSVTTTDMETAERPADVRNYKLLSIDSLSDRDFERVSQVPAIDAEDPIRGAVTFTTVENLTGSESRYTMKNPMTGTIEEFGSGQTVAGMNRSWLRVLGWTSACAIAVMLVILRVRRRTLYS